jgi:RHS repeat-associated protein
MTHETDENGNTTEHVYDQYGRVTQVIELMPDGTQEVTTLTTADTGYPLLNDSPIGDPDTPAPAVPTSADLIERIEDSQGSVSGHTDRWGRWLDETDENGDTTTYQRDDAGRVVQKTSPDGSCEEYDYDHLGNKVFSSRMDATQCALPPQQRDPAQVERVWYTYESSFNQIKTTTDSLGNTTTYIYDYEEGAGNSGNLIRIEYPEVLDANGNPVTPTETFSYNAWGQVTSKTDPQGTVTSYVYTQGTPDEAANGATPLFLPGVTPVPGLLRQIIEDNGTLTRITAYTGFDATGSHRQMQITDAAGTALELVTVEDYDADGNRIRLTDAAGSVSERVTEYAYTDGNLTTITRYLVDGSTLVTEMQYDADGNLTWKRDPSGRETLYTYQNDTLNTVHTDQGIWQYDYDTDDRLTTVTDPFGNIRERDYDANGNVSVVMVNGKTVSTYTYDASGNLTQRTDALGQPYTFVYNTENRMIRQEDPAGAFVEYEYDADGRLWKTRDGNGNEIVREYEVVGLSGSCPSCTPLLGGVGGGFERLKRIIYPTFTKEFDYDHQGRVSEERYVVSGGTTSSVIFAYDAFGRLERTTGPDNETTTYTYDLLGRRVGVTDPSGQTQFEYDLWDNLIALIDAENQRTEFEYYADGTLWKERRPMGEETTYEYDPSTGSGQAGRLWKVTDAKNQTTEYGYDAQSRIETIAYADGKTVTLSYDADGNLAGYSDGTTSATYTYDDMGRKLTETVNYGSFSKSFSYTYYGNGLKHTFTAPDSTVYTYLYGLNNELQDVQIPGVGSISIPAYTWNRPATMNFPGGTQRTSAYDSLMRIQSLTVTDPGGTPLLNYQYSYDEVGNILTKTTEHGNYTYGYDAVSRLLTADNPVLDDEAYTYDNVGNRLTSADVSGSWSYNTNNELLGYADVEYEYDANGNLTQITVAGSVVWTYTYDAANRLVHVEDGTGTISADYYYDPFGRRLWKDVGGTKTYFFYSEEGLIAEYDASGVEIRSYGYKPDSTWTTDPLWLKEGGTYYWYQNDHLGTPQKLVAQNGTVVWSAQYSSFGEATIDIETVTNNLRFPGQYFDVETGLHYNYQRYYDPKIGRYVRKDPIGLDGGLNVFLYALNDPINKRDLLGLAFSRDDLDIKTGPPWDKGGTPKISFSCNCGWIDWTHLNPKGARELLNKFKDSPYYFISYGQDSLRLGFIGPEVRFSYKVWYGLSQPEIYEVALAIFMEVSVAFEEEQGRFIIQTPIGPWRPETRFASSFSEEDLVSNLLGFYRAAHGYSVPDIKRLCDVWDPKGSKWVWDRLSATGWKPGKNNTWKPILYDILKTPIAGNVPPISGPGTCCPNSSFPSEFQSIQPATKGIGKFLGNPEPRIPY